MNKYYGVIFTSLVIILGIGIGLVFLGKNTSMASSITSKYPLIIESGVLDNQTGNTNTSISISSDKQTANIDIPNFKDPTSSEVFTILIKNISSIKVSLKDLTKYIYSNNPNISIEYLDLELPTVINANEALSFSVKVYYKTETIFTANNNIKFSITLNY